MVARKHVIGFGLLLAAATSVPAVAQPATSTGYARCDRKPTSAESEQAHAKYLAGKVDYDEGKYDDAIRQFKEAYTKDCEKHELLVIISAAYEKKAATSTNPVADIKEAIKVLEAFVAFSPSSPDVPTYKAKIENLRRDLDKRAATTTTTTAPPPPPSTSTDPPPPPPPDADKREHTIYPWLVVGAGGVAIVGGAVLVVIGNGNRPDNCNFSTESCTPRKNETTVRAEDQKAAGDAKGQQTAGIVCLIGGGVLAVGGLVWHFLEPTGPKEAASRTKVRPAVAPGYGGLALSGSF